jgi:hypothetical protein
VVEFGKSLHRVFEHSWISFLFFWQHGGLNLGPHAR